MCIYIYTWLYTYTYICIHVYMCICIHIYRNTHIYAHKYIIDWDGVRTVPIILYRVAKTLGSPKLQIIFHKRATKYRSLLQKMTYKDKGSYESSPPYSYPQDGSTRRNRGEYATQQHVWISHVTHTNESCRTYEMEDMTHW